MLAYMAPVCQKTSEAPHLPTPGSVTIDVIDSTDLQKFSTVIK